MKSKKGRNATEEDKIVFKTDRLGAGIIPVLYFRGKETPLTRGPVGLNNLANAVNDGLQRIN